MIKLYAGMACVLLAAFSIAARIDTGTGGLPPKNGPHIETPEETWDFGSIKQGDVVKHVFLIKNTGTDTLKISNTQASCGCTTTMVDTKNIPPGGEGKLQATFNSAGKMNHIVKTIYIYSNDITTPNKTVQITADIQTQPASVHAGTMSSMVHLDGIFEGDCATCHVDKGRGLTGKALFDADCGVCHGPKAEGKPGPELTSASMLHYQHDDYVRIISGGLDGKMMPAFSKANHGPLSDTEIKSLADYLTETSKAQGSK